MPVPFLGLRCWRYFLLIEPRLVVILLSACFLDWKAYSRVLYQLAYSKVKCDLSAGTNVFQLFSFLCHLSGCQENSQSDSVLLFFLLYLRNTLNSCNTFQSSKTQQQHFDNFLLTFPYNRFCYAYVLTEFDLRKAEKVPRCIMFQLRMSF